MEQVTLMPHQKLMITERNQLQDKITNLADFIGYNKLFLKLSEPKKELLRKQFECMREYLEVLETIIKAEVSEVDCGPQSKVEISHIRNLVESLEYKFERVGDTTVTGCWAFLPGGFQVGYGESACVDPNNFDFELGKTYSKERCVQNATNKLWELEGYLLALTGTTSDGL